MLLISTRFFDKPIAWVLVLGVVAWLALAGMIAAYGSERAYPFFPLFAAALMLGPLGRGSRAARHHDRRRPT